jgi:hypothetical protein
MFGITEILIIIGIIYLAIGAFMARIIWKGLHDEETRDLIDSPLKTMPPKQFKIALLIFVVIWPIAIIMAILDEKNENEDIIEEDIEETQETEAEFWNKWIEKQNEDNSS